MPKFHGQNKKRIDPRYFLNETTDRDIDKTIVTEEDGQSSIRHQGDSYGHAGTSGLDDDVDVEGLVQKLLTVMKTPTDYCEENPGHDDCFSEDFLTNMLKNRHAFGETDAWPEEVEDEMDLARYLCGDEGRNSEWSWVAAEASQMYVQLGEKGKISDSDDDTESDEGWTDSQKQASADRQARIAARKFN